MGVFAPLIPSSPKGISRDGSSLHGSGSGVFDSATEASISKEELIYAIGLHPRPISGEGWGEGILDSYDFDYTRIIAGVFLSRRSREFIRTVVGTLPLATNFLIGPNQ